MNWCKIIFSADDISAGRHKEFLEEFNHLLARSGAPNAAAVFLNKDKWREYSIYVSPVAAQLATELINRYGGVPCPAPKQSDVVGIRLTQVAPRCSMRPWWRNTPEI
jgi:hypothetical protein